MKGADDFPCELCGSDRYDVRYDFSDSRFLACTQCGLLSARPKGARTDPKSLYDRDYYESRCDYYFQNIVADPQGGLENENIADFQRGLATLETYKDPSRCRLLDVGCALGIFVALAARRGWDAQGIDVSPYAVEFARSRFGLPAVCGELTEVKFPDKQFDVVTLWDVFEHFSNPSAQLREISRILKDDGLVLLDTPNAHALIRRLAHFLYRVSMGRLSYPARKLHHVYHCFYYSKQTLRWILAKNGFEVILMRGKPIPIVKARASALERHIVKGFSRIEDRLGMEYEIWMLLRKAA